MGNLGTGCSVPEIVSDPEECRAAGIQLGRFLDFRVNAAIVPSGCYYMLADSSIVAFNHATPDFPQNIDFETGGVCKRGTYHILVCIVETHGKLRCNDFVFR